MPIWEPYLLLMGIEHAAERAYALCRNNEVSGRESNAESCTYEHCNENSNRSILTSFVSTYILSPARKRWLKTKNPDEFEAEQAYISSQGRQPFEVQIFAPEEDGYIMRTPKSQICSRIPDVASQTQKMDLLLLDEHPRLEDLKKTAWNGCSSKNRAQVWRLLLGYEPPEYKKRSAALTAKRAQYRETLRQINLDLPRTHPDVPIFHVAQTRNIMRRVLFLYSMLNPGRSYVQGMNEILTPLVVVFVNDLIKAPDERGVEDFMKRKTLPAHVPEKKLDRAEADIFWVFLNLLSSVEDNFTPEQPGMLKRVSRLQEIVSDVDPALATHLTKIEVEFLQFAYRWMNCLLMRELPLPLVIRVWDALLAEDDGISDLHVYFCAALLINFSETLLTMEFEEAILFLQHLPTREWTVTDIDKILSQAYQWKETLSFKSLSGHLSSDPSVMNVKACTRVS